MPEVPRLAVDLTTWGKAISTYGKECPWEKDHGDEGNGPHLPGVSSSSRCNLDVCITLGLLTVSHLRTYHAIDSHGAVVNVVFS